MVYANCAINPIIYCLQYEQFRSTAAKMFGCHFGTTQDDKANSQQKQVNQHETSNKTSSSTLQISTIDSSNSSNNKINAAETPKDEADVTGRIQF